MATTIPQRDLRNRNAQIIDRVVAGETFVVTRDGRPVAVVRPHDGSARPPRFRRATDLADFLTPSAVDGSRWLDDIRASDELLDDTAWDD